MCGEVTSKQIKDNFDKDTHCYVVKGIARRYIGLPEDILSEIKGAGFNILHSKIHPRRDEEDQDELLVDVTKLP
jgi:adenylate kinase